MTDVYRTAKPAYLSVQAFADHFAISKMAVYRLCHEGAVRHLRFGHAMRIPVAEVARYARAAEQAGVGERRAA